MNRKTLYRSMNRYLLLLISQLFLGSLWSCGPKSNLEKVDSSVQVKIPVARTDAKGVTAYNFEVVTLQGIANLKEVAGDFVRFIYTPGIHGSELVGEAPQARFVRNKSGVFVALDDISQQMATIYYTIQNLSLLSDKVGAKGINQSPFRVGIETNVADEELLSKNNAFYDGQTDAMLFVPFTKQNLPIAVNPGIIAHEYFHSLFYKVVFKNTAFGLLVEPSAGKMTTEKNIQALYNETYLRGLNEGLADFWGWLYTNDSDFMRWSLTGYSNRRKLELSANSIGSYETQVNILDRVQSVSSYTTNTTQALSDYIYEIGTPQARFLKELTTYTQQQIISSQEVMNTDLALQEAKFKVAGQLISYLRDLALQAPKLKAQEILPADSLFQYFASEKAGLKFSSQTCDFVMAYLHLESGKKKCEKQDDGSYKIVLEADKVKIKLKNNE